MKNIESEWNDGVELAYLLNRSMDFDKQWTLYLASPETTIKNSLDAESEGIAFTIDRAATTHLKKINQHAGRRDNMYTPEPYNELCHLSNNLSTATIMHGQEPELFDKTVSEHGALLRQELFDAVCQLMARDVYVQGMNPHESEAYSEEATAQIADLEQLFASPNN